MLNNVNSCISMVVLVMLSACHQQEQKNIERNHKILEVSKATMSESKYNTTYQQALDSLNTWCSQKLPNYRSIWSFNYRLDSVLCFNSQKDRIVTAILVQCHRQECETDDVHYFYGAKIKGRWYFFQGGGTMVIIRENYQKNIHTPVSFEKLHELAMEQMFRGYVKKDRAEKWVINDAFFAGHFEDIGWGDFNRQLPKDTMPNGKHFTDKKAFFENIYLRGLGFKK